MRVTLFLLLGLLLLGCRHQKPSTPHVPPAAPPAIPARPPSPVSLRGLRLDDTQERALYILPGMAPTNIVSLIGVPDETSSGTYGGATAKSWQGIEWRYRWKTGYATAKRLVIVFSNQPENGWAVNHWQWHDF